MKSEIRAWGRVHHESRLAPEHRIYVNRNLRLASVEAIGFDLDHTLAHYRGPAVEDVSMPHAGESFEGKTGSEDVSGR